MNDVLILGSGGREHALTWKLSQSNLCNLIYIAPGNAGTQQLGTNVDLDITDFSSIGNFCLEKNIEYLIVGPELPLVQGIVDFFATTFPNIKVLGPDENAAQLEGSKDFANRFMEKYKIPTAGYKTFSLDEITEAKSHIEESKGPYVLKADGLAGGKGVLIFEDQNEAKKAIEEMLSGKFGEASSKVVVEEFLSGIEFSVFVITDGENYKLLPTAKDYKRIGEGDKGLNTGGMGAISPVPFVQPEIMNKVIEKIIQPTIAGFREENMNYKGFVFFGLILVEDEPYVIEYNCRLGDPETEVILPRMDVDLMAIIKSVFNNQLSNTNIKFDPRTAATVMLVSGGYPQEYEKNKEILVPENYSNSVLFHAGTKAQDGKLFTNGGRVLSITSFGKDHIEATKKSMVVCKKVQFDGKYFRSDIGFDL